MNWVIPMLHSWILTGVEGIAALLLLAGCNADAEGVPFGHAQAEPACVLPNDAAQLASEVLTLVNEQRAVYGLNPVTENPRLADSAADYACEMIEQNFFSHVNSTTGADFEDRVNSGEFKCYSAGENLARGSDSAEQVVAAWMNSNMHRANILNDDFLEMGVGIIRDAADGQYYWVQQFIGDDPLYYDCDSGASGLEATGYPDPDPNQSDDLLNPLHSQPQLP